MDSKVELIGWRQICNLQFADGIDVMRGPKDILINLRDSLVRRTSAYSMEISTEKPKVMVNRRHTQKSQWTGKFAKKSNNSNTLVPFLPKMVLL